MVNSNDTGQNASTQSAHDRPTRDTPPNSHQAMAADAKAANKRFPDPTSLVMSSSRPATNTGNAAMNSTGHNQVKVMLLGPSTSKPARLPASTAKPPTRDLARECVAWGFFMSDIPANIHFQRFAPHNKPTPNQHH